MAVGTSFYEHKELVPSEFHAIGYVQSTDPGALGEGVAAHATGKGWFDTSGGAGNWALKIRNETDTGWELIASGLGGVPPIQMNARLTLETGVPISTTDQTAKTQIYLTNYEGDEASVYNGTTWITRHLTSDISIKLTDTQNGTTTNGSAVITGLADTSQLIVGMEVTGTNIPASTTISSINPANTTEVTLNNNATGSGTVAITFKDPANIVHDVFVIDDPTGASPKLKLKKVKWSSLTARATALTEQNGYEVLTGFLTHRYVGSYCTTATAGQTEFSPHGGTNPRLYLWNRYKQIQQWFKIIESADSWTYSTATIRQWNNTTANRVEFVRGLDNQQVYLQFQALVRLLSAGGFAQAFAGIGLDSTTVFSSDTMAGAHTDLTTSSVGMMANASYRKFPGIGYHALNLLERGSGVNTTTWFGDGGAPTFVQSGGVGYIWC